MEDAKGAGRRAIRHTPSHAVPCGALATRWCRNAEVLGWAQPNQRGGHRGGDMVSRADWLGGTLVCPCVSGIGFEPWS